MPPGPSHRASRTPELPLPDARSADGYPVGGPMPGRTDTRLAVGYPVDGRDIQSADGCPFGATEPARRGRARQLHCAPTSPRTILRNALRPAWSKGVASPHAKATASATASAAVKLSGGSNGYPVGGPIPGQRNRIRAAKSRAGAASCSDITPKNLAQRAAPGLVEGRRLAARKATASATASAAVKLSGGSHGYPAGGRMPGEMADGVPGRPMGAQLVGGLGARLTDGSPVTW